LRARHAIAVVFSGAAFAYADASCAAVLGLDDEGASMTELCDCAALSTKTLSDNCRSLVATKEDDVAFLKKLVDAGCPSCDVLPACLELLGAKSDGTTCASDAECGSTHCCDGTSCCSGCHECAGPVPHCSMLFAAAASCLVDNHGSACAASCSGPPAQVGDACWTCLANEDAAMQKCGAAIDACEVEPRP
jgi:hypothetical protein